MLAILVAYPIYIKYLGFISFSVWTTLTIVISFAKMGEFGISKALIAYIPKEINNKEKIRYIISNALYILLAVSLLIIIIVLTSNDLITKILNIPVEFTQVTSSIIPLIGLSVALFLFVDMFNGVIAGYNRLDISNLLLLINNILKILISIILLEFGLKLFALVYSIILSNIVTTVIQIIFIMKKFKLNILNIKGIKHEYLKYIFDFGSIMFGMQVLNMLTGPLTKVILTNSLGVVSVGIFEIAFRASYALRTFFTKGLFAIMPQISGLLQKSKINHQTNNNPVLKKVNQYTKLLVLYAIPFFMLISILAPWWLKLWLGRDFVNSILYGYWLLQPGIVIGLLAIPSFYALMATDNQKYCFYEALIRALVMLTFLLIFYLFTLKLYFAFLFISISVIMSNVYVIIKFRHLQY